MNKCNSCSKFLTCDRRKCEKISFVEAKILEKAKIEKFSTRSDKNFNKNNKNIKQQIKQILGIQERIKCQ